MDLLLSQVEYTEAGVISGKNCLHVLPGEHSRTGNKVAVGNKKGELRVFGVHPTSRAVVGAYRTEAFRRSPMTCMALAQVPKSDKVAIFVGGKSTPECPFDVRAYSKQKDHPFISFNTQLSDPLYQLDVYQHDVFVASDNTFDHYYNCSDSCGFFASPHHITDISYVSNDDLIYPIVGSSDRIIRMMETTTVPSSNTSAAIAALPKTKETKYEVEMPGQTVCLRPYHDLGQTRTEILYGTKDGRLGLTSFKDLKIRQRFCLKNEKKKGSIDSISVFDLDNDGVNEVVVGRSDGIVEVFRFEKSTATLELCAKEEFPESVVAVSCGNVGSKQHTEVVVATYSGRILGLSMDPDLMKAPPTKDSKPKEGMEVAGSKATRLQSLQKEIGKLEKELAEQQYAMQEQQPQQQQGHVDMSHEYTLDPCVDIHSEFRFDHADANYVLVLESPVDIDFLALRSDATMDILDLDKNTVMPSQCTPDPERKTLVSYTFRCGENTQRVVFKIRPIEGQQGTLTVLVCLVPKMSKTKVSRELTFDIQPLCLHSIIHTDEREKERVLSTLEYTGNLTLDEVHALLYPCCPNLGPKPEIKESPAQWIVIVYQSAITKTIIYIKYKAGELVLKSDNISTLSILKEFITKQMQQTRRTFDCTMDIQLRSALWMLQLINDRVAEQLAMAQKLHLYQALKDVQLSEGGNAISSPEYKEILDNGELLQRQSERSNSLLERLYGTITDLYIDYYRLEGINTKRHIGYLLGLLDDYDLDKLMDFFQRDPEGPVPTADEPMGSEKSEEPDRE